MRDGPTDSPNLLERLDQGRVKFELLGTPESLTRLGRFIVFARVGAGGMGVIYHAYDPELDRGVAIKLLRPAVTARGGHRRLLREARAMARLAHPNVVQVFEVGVLDEQVFLVMEFVAGQTLRGWLAAAPRSVREVLAMFLQATAGLIATHAHGLVHCDFKPENVLIGADGRARVGDFGLVQAETDETEPPAIEQLRARQRPPEAVSTSGSRIGGTPRYMAPEQLQGRAADPRSDQFSLCVALYEALAPELFEAFVRDESVGARVMRGERLPPLVVAGMPAELGRVIARGLEPDPAHRWPALSDLQTRLASLAARSRARGWRWGLGAGLALGLVAGGVDGLSAQDEPSCDSGAAQIAATWDEPQRAQLRQIVAATGLGFAADTGARIEARLDLYAQTWRGIYSDVCEAHRRGEVSATLLDRTMQCLATDRGALASLVEQLRKIAAPELERAMDAVLLLPELERCRDAGLLLAEVAPPADPATALAVLEVKIQLAVGRSEWALGHHDVARRMSEASLGRAEELGYAPLLAQALYRVGRQQKNRDERGAAETTLMRALVLASESGDDEQFGMIAAMLAELTALPGDRWPEARLWAQLGRAVTGRVAPRGASHVQSLHASGILELEAGQYAEAIRWFEQALALAEEEFGRDSIMALEARDMLGSALSMRGDHSAALAQFERAAEVQLQVFGAGHPALVVHHNNRAMILRGVGRDDEALSALKQALALALAAYGPDGIDVAAIQANIAAILMDRNHPGDLEAAEPYFRRSIAARETQLGPDDPELAISLSALGNLYLKRLELDAAEPLFKRAMALRERSVGASPLLLLMPLWDLGYIAGLRGDHVVQAQYYGRVLAIEEQARGPDDPGLASTLYALAEAAIHGGDLELAGRHLTRADRLVDAATASKTTLQRGLAVRGKLARRRGEFTEACDLLARALSSEQAREVEPASADLLTEYALALAAAGRPDEARPLADRAAAFYRRGGPALAWRADELTALQRRLGSG